MEIQTTNQNAEDYSKQKFLTQLCNFRKGLQKYPYQKALKMAAEGFDILRYGTIKDPTTKTKVTSSGFKFALICLNKTHFKRFLKSLPKWMFEINIDSEYISTPLHEIIDHATSNNGYWNDVIEKVIERTPSVDVKDMNGNLPIFNALKKSDYIFRMTLEKSFMTRAIFNEKPLSFHLLQSKKYSNLEKLFERDNDILLDTFKSKSLLQGVFIAKLHLNKTYSHMVERMIDCCKNIDHRNDLGETAIFTYVKNLDGSYPALYGKFIEKGADVTTPVKQNYTLLEYSAIFGQKTICLDLFFDRKTLLEQSNRCLKVLDASAMGGHDNIFDILDLKLAGIGTHSVCSKRLLASSVIGGNLKIIEKILKFSPLIQWVDLSIHISIEVFVSKYLNWNQEKGVFNPTEKGKEILSLFEKETRRRMDYFLIMISLKRIPDFENLDIPLDLLNLLRTYAYIHPSEFFVPDYSISIEKRKSKTDGISVQKKMKIEEVK